MSTSPYIVLFLGYPEFYEKPQRNKKKQNIFIRRHFKRRKKFANVKYLSSFTLSWLRKEIR